MPIRSGITRWSIWPSVSRVSSSSPAALGAATARLWRVSNPFAQLEGVIIGDDDLGPVQIVKHVAWNKFAAGVVAVGIIRLQNSKAVFDGQAWSNDQKTLG